MKHENGRTLVETLAMLAIVGILSVVGMRGYTSAMDKSKANNLIQEAQKRAVIVAGQIGFNNQTPSLAEFSPPNPTAGGTFGDVKTTGLTKQFGIQVSNVSKSICQNILNTIGDTTPIRRLSKEGTPTTPISSCDEDNAFLFIYNNDMTGDDKIEPPRSCRTVNDCATACATCEIPEDEEVGICINECEAPVRLCQTDNDCNVENECNVCDTESGLCKNACTRVEYLESTGTQYILAYNGETDDTFGLKMEFSMQSQPDNYPAGFSTTNNKRFLFWGASSGYAAWLYGWGSASTGMTGPRMPFTEYPAGLNNYYTATLNYLNNKKVSFGDSGLYVIAATSERFTNTNFLLFKSYSSAMPARIKSAIVTKGANVIRDFIPFSSPKGNCLFDRVSQKLFCNQGTGDDFKTNLDE